MLPHPEPDPAAVTHVTELVTQPLSIHNRHLHDPRDTIHYVSQATMTAPSRDWQMSIAAASTTASKILVIDDDPAMLHLVRLIADENGYEVATADSGAAGIRLALDGSPDLIILDLVLPDMSGIEVCRRLRTAGVRATVMMVSCLHDSEDVVIGLEVGADDSLRKPLEVRELVARINARLRRARLLRQSTVQDRLQFPGLSIDLGRHEVRRDDRSVALTPTRSGRRRLPTSTSSRASSTR